jgi:hypothetical protein
MTPRRQPGLRTRRASRVGPYTQMSKVIPGLTAIDLKSACVNPKDGGHPRSACEGTQRFTLSQVFREEPRMPSASLDDSFEFKTTEPQVLPDPTDVPPSPSLLDSLAGTWEGKGFNAIWVPRWDQTPSHFLMLMLTEEIITFSRIPGVIPNRGALQQDIGMTGLTYMQQISDRTGRGLHIEPGIWATVPNTTAPAVAASVVRLASIPHGTTVLLQGTAANATQSGALPTLATAAPTSLQPSPVTPGSPPQIGPSQDMPELNLDQEEANRTAPLPAEISQDLVNNPTSLLDAQNEGLNFASMTTIQVTTTGQPIPGGGAVNTAFLAGIDGTNENGNASANQVEAFFWIEEVAAQGDDPAFNQLQYAQTVMLDFSGQRWPHVTVATLRQTSAGPQAQPPAPPRVVLPQPNTE